MVNDRAILSVIKTNLEKIQIWFPRAALYAGDNSRFMTAIHELRTAVQPLQDAFTALSDIRSNPDTRYALQQIRLLATDIERFAREPANLKLPTANTHYKELLTIMLKIDPTFRPLGEDAPALQTMTSEQRKQRFLDLWRNQNGLSRMRSILTHFITLKRLIVANTKLDFTNSLNERSQARTRQGETQATIGTAFVSQLDDLYAQIFRPCLEDDIAVFYGGQVTVGRSRFTRSCATRIVSFDGQSTQDPIILMASDLCCINGVDSFAGGRSQDLQRKIGSDLSAPYLVRTFDKLRVVVHTLTQLVSSDTPALRELLIRWVDEDNQDFHLIGQHFIREYPQEFHNASREAFLRGL